MAGDTTTGHCLAEAATAWPPNKFVAVSRHEMTLLPDVSRQQDQASSKIGEQSRNALTFDEESVTKSIADGDLAMK